MCSGLLPKPAAESLRVGDILTIHYEAMGLISSFGRESIVLTPNPKVWPWETVAGLPGGFPGNAGSRRADPASGTAAHSKPSKGMTRLES